MSVSYYIAVDVGTGSVRGALVDKEGTIKRNAEESITINKPKSDYFEQSSDEIWKKCCNVIKKITEDISSGSIRGIGFDATCSLVVLDDQFLPVPVTPDDSTSSFNIIMWLDHRAKAQADKINSGQHKVLKYFGGKISLEMQPPKILWLKENLPKVWKRAAHFFDLPDYLTFKATGSLTRSLCSLSCKFAYTVDDGMCPEFWNNIALNDIVDNKFKSIGIEVVPPGTPLGNGLTPEAAVAMNLQSTISVGASIIDGHCGGIGTIGADVRGIGLPCDNGSISERIAFICGTSSCHMAISQDAIFVPGIWGPYLSAMLPDMWLNEGGQSATGKVVDHIVQGHPAFERLKQISTERNLHVYECLNKLLFEYANDRAFLNCELMTSNLHIWPDFHGNRSPIGDSSLCGAICGLTLDHSLENLAKLYLATMQALASGSLHILETLESCGHNINTVFMCGGLSKNPLFVQIHANVLRRPVVLSKETETVLLGGAILGACASGDFPSIQEAMKSMCKVGEVIYPDKDTEEFYRKKHKVFLSMLNHQLEYKSIMST